MRSITEPREKLSRYAPRIFTMTIPTDKIRELIGPGGKMIRSIVDATGVKIDVDDDGTVNIFAADGGCRESRIQMVGDIAAVAEVGKTYLGKVVRIVDFGAFVEIFPGTDGLLHISEISENRVKQVRDELNEGDQIMVKVLALEGQQDQAEPQGNSARAAREVEEGRRGRRLREWRRQRSTGRSRRAFRGLVGSPGAV